MYNTFHHVMIGTCQTAVHVNYTIAASFYNFIIGGVEVGFAVVSGSSVGICKRSRSLCVFFRASKKRLHRRPYDRVIRHGRCYRRHRARPDRVGRYTHRRSAGTMV